MQTIHTKVIKKKVDKESYFVISELSFEYSKKSGEYALSYTKEGRKIKFGGTAFELENPIYAFVGELLSNDFKKMDILYKEDLVDFGQECLSYFR